MSPLTMIYLLMASPIFSGSHFGGEFPSNWENTWNMPSSWSNNWESSSWTPEWFGEHSSVFTPSSWTPSSSFEEPTHFNWLLRKALRTSTVSPRSLLREMTGRRSSLFSEEYPTTFGFNKLNKIDLIRIVKVIRRLAETNPIVLEKLVRCPVMRSVIEKVLRTCEPETLFAIEKLIRSVIPVEVRDKITRRLVKNLIKSEEEFSPRFFNSRRSILSEMLYRPESSIFSSEVYSPESKVLSKVLRRLVKSNVFEHKNVDNKVWILKKLIKKVMRHELPVESMCNVCEKVCTPFSYSKYSTPSCYTTEKVCNFCNTICPSTTFESSIYSPSVFGDFESSIFNKEYLPFENIFGEHKLNKLSKKMLTKSSPLSWF